MDTRPLVITENHELLDDLLRVAAAAGVEVTHSSAPHTKLAWRSACVILLDSAKVRSAVLAGMPRRAGVLVVAPQEPSSEVWEQCVLLGVDRTLVLPAGEEALVRILSDATDHGPGDGRVIATIGARGGAGSSVLAAALAVAAMAAGSGVLLADCDPWGAGLDLLFGLESDPGVRWSDLAAPGGRLPADALHQALPSIFPGQLPTHSKAAAAQSGRLRSTGRPGLLGVLSILAFDRTQDMSVPPHVLDVVLDSCRRAGDLAILDLPRVPDASAELALDRADLVAIVVPADVPACYAARRVVERVLGAGVEAGIVVRGPAPGGLGADDVATALHLPLLSQMRPQPGLARALELGRPPGVDRRSPLARTARLVLQQATGTARSAA